MKSPPLIPPEELTRPREPWERENIANMWPYLNELGRSGMLPADYGRAKSQRSEDDHGANP